MRSLFIFVYFVRNKQNRENHNETGQKIEPIGVFDKKTKKNW